MARIPLNPIHQQILRFLSKFEPSGNHLLISIPTSVRRDNQVQASRVTVTEPIIRLLQTTNEDCDIYFTINEVNNGVGISRKKNEVTKFRCVFLDDDNKTAAKPYPLPPSIRVTTSPGKKQVYWIISDQPASVLAWDQVQQTLVNEYGGDPASRDAARIQRVPGFYNRKKDYNPPPFITLDECNDNIYTWAEITTAFPPSEVIGITGKSKTDTFDYDGTIELFVSGKNYHEAGLALIGYYYNKGMRTAEVLTNTMRTLLKSHADENDPRVRHRLEIDIPGSVSWVLRERLREQEESRRIIADESVRDVVIDLEEAEKPISLTEDIINIFPEPMPTLLYNFKEMIYTPVEAMYVPCFMAIHEVLLQSKIRTERDRGVNCNYATGSLSGGGKDDNTVEALRRYLNYYIKINGKQSSFIHFLALLLNPITGSFTSGTNLLKQLADRNQDEGDKNIGGVLISTEATEFFKMIANTGNAHMSDEVMKVEIQAFDGISIEGRKVTTNEKNHSNAIDNPNFSFVRMTQFEAFKNAFTIPMLEKGYYPRIFESFDLRENEEYVPSGRKNRKNFSVYEEGFKFLFFMLQEIERMTQPIKVVSNYKGTPIDTWDMENMPRIRAKLTNEQFPGMKRIPTMGEKWVGTVTAYNYFWRLFKGYSVDDIVLSRSVNGEVLELDGTVFESRVIPMLDYLARVKYYNITKNIEGSGASESEAIFAELWHKALKGNTVTKPWTDLDVVVATIFNQRVQKNAKLARLFPDPEKAMRMRDRWLSDNGFCKSNPICGKIGARKKVCYVTKGGKYDPNYRGK